MKVSFCIPIFNKELYLNECLVTVLTQTYKNIEVILVDDSSTDGTREICEFYAAKDKRIKYIRNDRNHGVGYTRNVARSIATGDIILVQDADDMSFKDRAERTVKFFKANPKVDIMYGACLITDGNNRNISVNHARPFEVSQIKKNNYISHPTVAYRKRVNIPYRDVRYIDDWYFHLDCFTAGYKFGYVNDVISSYRITHEGLTLKDGYLPLNKDKARKKLMKEFDDLEENLDKALRTPMQKERIKQILKEIPRNSDVLDIGCNAGYIMERIKKKDCSVMGVEKSHYLCDIAQEKGLDVRTDIPDNLVFDVVLLCDILEHYNKKEASKLVYTALNRLRKGGKLIITVPFKHGRYSSANVEVHVKDYEESDFKEFAKGLKMKIKPIFYGISAIPEWLLVVITT